MKRYKPPTYVQIDIAEDGEFVLFEDAAKATERAFDLLGKYVAWVALQEPQFIIPDKKPDNFTEAEYEI